MCFTGPWADQDNLGTKQGMGRSLGQLEGWKVCRAGHRHHGGSVHDNIQETDQIQSRP